MTPLWVKGLCMGLLALLACSQQQSQAPPYPQNPAVSDSRGIPRDTTIFYFPAADSLHATYVPKAQRGTKAWSSERVTNCAGTLVQASYDLTYFAAPVLSNYYLHAAIYRFLWQRSFHRPVLLTLRQDATGATLRTQLLDKSPGFYTLTLIHPDSLAPATSPKEKARVKAYYEERMADPAWHAQVAESKRRAVQVVAEETTRRLTQPQVRAFEELLDKAHFWQVPGCVSTPVMLDGAQWLLEAHQANRYHMVNRASPDENDRFRRACEYLINLSSVRQEERY